MNSSDNSEDNDVLSDIDYMEFKNANIDAIPYCLLVNNVREALSANISSLVEKSSLSVFFCELLNNCSVCIEESLETVTNQLQDETNTNTLHEYLNDAVSLLQMLLDFNKNVVMLSMDNVAELYKYFPENFPTTTGYIIMTVFSHCSNSEKVYGDNLKNFEVQLKGLFKNCHELQLNYLSILEMHDFQLEVLTQALKINLKIGEIVQSLDVKTMAEQWKSFTTICEKFSNHLRHTNLFRHCSKILCRMITKSVCCAVEENQEEKVILRSLKVASFTIKILLKICGISNALKRMDYIYFYELIYDIYVHRDSELYNVTCKSNQFLQLYNTNIIVPADCLIKELVMDEGFHSDITGFDTNDHKLATVYILVHTSVMKTLLRSDEFLPKYLIIRNVLDIFDVPPRLLKIQGLRDHMLVHTAAFATTLNNEDFNQLEKRLFKYLLNDTCEDAMFSANLWILLARYTSPQFVFNQLIWLCSMYKKLSSNRMFNISPQKIHLGYTLSKLFEILDDDDKMKICKQFRVNDDDNLPLWIAIGIHKLPNEMKNVAEEGVFEKLKSQFAEINNDKSNLAVDTLINLLNLTATCTFTNKCSVINTIVWAWLRICPNQQALPYVHSTTAWFYDYVGALTAVTEAVLDKALVDEAWAVKVLHTVTNLIERDDTELKLTLTQLLCKLAAYNVSEYRNKVNSECCSAFSNMFLFSEQIVRNNLITTLSEFRNNRHFCDIFSTDDEVQEIWTKIKSGDYNELIKDSDVKLTRIHRYRHTCLEMRKPIQQLSRNSTNSVQEIQNTSQNLYSVSEMRKINSSNFDFDVEMVFEESEEPMCKKVKLDNVEMIVSRLENDSTQLCNVKENVFTSEYRTRIRNICDKLSNLIN